MSTRTDRNGKPLPPIEILETVANIADSEVDGDAALSKMLSDLDRAKATWRRELKLTEARRRCGF